MSDIIWDIETYPNVFTAFFADPSTKKGYLFEISDRRNDAGALRKFCARLYKNKDRLVGFNSVGFDYIVLHYFLKLRYSSAQEIYDIAQQIIFADDEEKKRLKIRPSDWFIDNLDLYLLNHFDNKAKSTGLKALEFNMRSDSIEDLPFPPGTVLTNDQIDTLITYNKKDVFETLAFYHENQEAIAFREELSERYGTSFVNFSDSKIGSEMFIYELEKHQPGICYKKDSLGRRKINQTRYKNGIVLKDCILDYVKFENDEFNKVLDYLKAQRIKETKGVFTNLTAVVDGLTYAFGTGGIHASIETSSVVANDEYAIIDLDVASYYPNLAIKNRFYPAHLSEVFCEQYERLYNERSNYKKGTPLNLAIKLALNATYGNSNSEYSPFFDSMFTMKITLNGQLLLCMLAERLLKIEGLKVIQCNTDGITVWCKRALTDKVDEAYHWWEQLTKLTMEKVEYKSMYIRDVNNYIAVTVDGKVKCKGAYEYFVTKKEYESRKGEKYFGGVPISAGWHKNHSAMVIARAAEYALVHDGDVEHYIRNHKDVFDFMLRAKVPRSSSLVLCDGLQSFGMCRWCGNTEQVTKGNRCTQCDRLLKGVDVICEYTVPVNPTLTQNICRYYVSNEGRSLVKVMPPIDEKEGKEKYVIQFSDSETGESVYVDDNAQRTRFMKKGWVETDRFRPQPRDRCMNVESGQLVKLANKMVDFDGDLNYDWYINEAKKLVDEIKANRFGGNNG